MHKIIIAILSLIIVHPAWAQPTPPAEIQSIIDAARKHCEETFGKFAFNPGALKSADLNGDGYPDYVLSSAGYSCEGVADLSAGTDKPHHVFLSSGDKILKEDSATPVNAFSFSIDEKTNPPQIIYQQHCLDGKGADAFESRWNWTGTAMAEVNSTAVMCKK